METTRTKLKTYMFFIDLEIKETKKRLKNYAKKQFFNSAQSMKMKIDCLENYKHDLKVILKNSK